MKLKLILLFLVTTTLSYSQIGVGTTTPAPSAAFDVTSSNQGFAAPRMTSAQRDAIVSPAAGLMIYNLTNHCYEWFQNSGWFNACSGVNTFIDPTSGGSSNIAIVSCTTASTGALYVGVPASGVTQTITVDVKVLGTYKIFGLSVYGFIYEAEGIFTSLGVQTITLIASGTPIKATGPGFVPLSTIPTCNFIVKVN